jgi:hypothetical protein
LGAQAGPVAGSGPDREIGLARVEIGAAVHALQFDLNAAMLGVKARQPGHQPVCRQRGGQADLERMAVRMAADAIARVADRLDRRREMRKVGFSGLRKLQRARFPVE